MIICGSVCCLMQYDCKGKLGLTDTKSVLRCVYYHFECLSEPVRLKTLKILGIRKLPRTVVDSQLHMSRLHKCIRQESEGDGGQTVKCQRVLCVCAALQHSKGILMHCTNFGTKDLIAQTTSLSSHHLHPPIPSFPPPPRNFQFKAETTVYQDHSPAYCNTFTQSSHRPTRSLPAAKLNWHTVRTTYSSAHIYEHKVSLYDYVCT